MDGKSISALVQRLSIDELALLRDLASIRLAHEGKRCARCQGPMGLDDDSDICTRCVVDVYLEVEWQHALARRDPVAAAVAGWRRLVRRFDAGRR